MPIQPKSKPPLRGSSREGTAFLAVVKRIQAERPRATYSEAWRLAKKDPVGAANYAVMAARR